MKITSIIVRRISIDSKMKAIVSITFDDVFVVHDVKVIEGVNGLFIAMPSRRSQDGEFKDIVHPINSSFREELSAAVIEKYQEALENFGSGEKPDTESVEEVSVTDAPEASQEEPKEEAVLSE